METGRQGEAITLILKTMKEQGLDNVAEAMNRGLFKATNDVKLEWGDMLKAFGRSETVMAPVNSALWLVHRNLQIIKEYAEDDAVKGVLGGSGKIRGATPPISPKDFGGMSELDFRLQQLRGQIEYYKTHQRPKGPEGADLQDYIRQLRQQLEVTKESAVEEKVLFDLQEKRWKNATPALREQAVEYARQLDLRKQEAQILAANLRYYEYLAGERDRQNDAVNQFNTANTETLQQLDLETKLIGKSREQQELLTGLTKLESEYRKASANLTGRAAESARELYEQQKRDLEDAIRGKNAAQRIQDQIDETKNAAKQMNEDLQRGLTDSIFRGFEAGKGFARNFRDALVNMFKTTILRPVIQWVVSPITGAITAAMGGLGIPGLANAAGGGAGGGLGALGNLSSLSGISDMFGGLVGGANAVFQNLGVNMGSQFLADIGNFGFGVPVLGGLTNLLMGNTRGAIGSTALGIAGTMIGGPIGGAIGSFVGSMFGGSSKTPSQHLGHVVGVYGSDGQRSISSAGPDVGGNAARTLEAMYQQFDAYAKMLGATYSNQFFQYGANTGRNSQNPNFWLSAGNYRVGEHIGSFQPLNDQNLQLQMSRGVLSALQSSQLPGFLKGYFDSLAPASMDKAAIDNALGFAVSLKQVRDALFEARAPLEIMQDQLLELFEKLGTSADRFKEDFKSAIESGLTPETLAPWQQLSTLAGQFVTRLTAAEQTARGYAAGLPGQLGITGLTGFRDSLAVSEFRSPLDRFGSARALLNENYGRAIGGDLAAVQAFPQLAQQLLGIGRDVYASGPQFAEVFVEVNRQLQDVLSRQQDLQVELLRDIDVAIIQNGQDQIAELRNQTRVLVEELREVRAELRRISS